MKGGTQEGINKMKKINIIITICVIVIAVCILFNTIHGIYYEVKYTIRNHDERRRVCDANENSVYIKSLQSSKDIVECCELLNEGGLDHISYCEEILI